MPFLLIFLHAQIPGGICTACADAASKSPRSPAVTASITALKRLVYFGYVPQQQTSNKPLTACLWQQVEHSGLLKQLPAILSAAASDLAAERTSIASTTSGSSTARTSASSSSSSSAMDSTSSGLILHADALLAVVLWLQDTCTTSKPGAECMRLMAPAILQFVMRLVQYTEVLDPQARPAHQEWSNLLMVTNLCLSCCMLILNTLNCVVLAATPEVDSACQGLESVLAQVLQAPDPVRALFAVPQVAQLLQSPDAVSALVGPARPDAAQLLQSPDVWSCVAWATAVVVFSAAGHWKEHGGGSSRTITEQTALLALKQVPANLRFVTSCYQKLFQLLQVTSNSVLLTAGAMRYTGLSLSGCASFMSAAMLARRLLRTPQPGDAATSGSQSSQADEQSSQSPQADTESSQADRQLQLQIDVLLPCLWLRLATKLAKAQSDIELVQSAATLINLGLLESAAQAGSQDQPADRDADPWSVSGHLPAVVLEELLPRVLLVLGALARHQPQTHEQQKQHQETTAAYLGTLHLVLKRSGLPRESDSSSASGSTHTQPLDAVQVVQHVQHNMLTVLQQLECAVRTMARRASADVATLDGIASCLSRLLPLIPSSNSGSSGSKDLQVQHLQSLLVSLLKLARVYFALPDAQQSYGVGKCALSSLVLAAAPSVSVIRRLSGVLGTSDAPNAGGSSSGSSSSTSAATVNQSASIVSAMLPSLMLLGRCCLQLSHFWEGSHETVAQSARDLHVAMPEWLLKGVKVCLEWLSVSSVSQQLSAAGHQPQQVQQSLQQLNAVAQQAYCDSFASTTEQVEVLGQLVQHLRAVGLWLSSVPVSQMCNNPACANLSGPLELQLVNGKTSVCGGCRVARFCSKACLAQFWKQHKPVCQALAAAAAAAAAAAVAGDAPGATATATAEAAQEEQAAEVAPPPPPQTAPQQPATVPAAGVQPATVPAAAGV